MAPEQKLTRVAVKVLRSGLLVVILVAAAVALRMPVLGAPAHSVDVTIVANKSASGGFAFNGYQRGAMTVTVPVGWEVVVHFENADTVAHSLAVVPSGTHQQMTPASTPAFPGATTTNLAAGYPKGTKLTVTFEANKAGTYEFICGVPGHGVVGQWDALVVSATADAPSVTPPNAATVSVK